VRDGDAPARRAARPLAGVVLRVAGRGPEIDALRREAATLLQAERGLPVRAYRRGERR
jgi:hypothetical protein